MKVGFIRSQDLKTGADVINTLMFEGVQKQGLIVESFFPNLPPITISNELRGVYNIAAFYSLLERKKELMNCDLIQGTTFTLFPLLHFNIPIVSHFGSTTWDCLGAVPMTADMQGPLRQLWEQLRNDGVVPVLDYDTRQPLMDTAAAERFVASRAQGVIAASEVVRASLIKSGISPERIYLVPNAIENFWLSKKSSNFTDIPSLIFLGRTGNDAFNMRIKGIDRLIDLYRRFDGAVAKYTIGLSNNTKLFPWLDEHIPGHVTYANIEHRKIPELLCRHAGDILLVTSRYEGFSLSLVEGMSQGLIPVAYPVGVASEIIQNGENGFIIHSQEEGEVVLTKLLSSSKDERRRLSKAAIRTVQVYNQETMSARLVDVYKNVLRMEGVQSL